MPERRDAKTRPFSYQRASSFGEAASLLAENGAMPLGGGTDLLVCIDEGIVSPSTLVDLRAVADAEVITRLEGGDVRIGAAARIHDIAHDSRLRQQFPALTEACEAVGSPALR